MKALAIPLMIALALSACTSPGQSVGDYAIGDDNAAINAGRNRKEAQISRAQLEQHRRRRGRPNRRHSGHHPRLPLIPRPESSENRRQWYHCRRFFIFTAAYGKRPSEKPQNRIFRRPPIGKTI